MIIGPKKVCSKHSYVKGYLRRTFNDPEIIVLSNLIHMMTIDDLVAVDMETLKIDSLHL